MKKPTHRILDRAGWALAAAGTLGLAASAGAQTTPYAAATTWDQGHYEANQSGSPAKDQARAARQKVELAWLADPATFPYHLETRMVGTALEVRGYVPDESSHAQALRIARDQSGLRVVDGLKVYPGVAIPLVSKTASALQHDATVALERALPHHAHGITVGIWNNGQVVLTGSVARAEDKVVASRCLSGVSGCSCVVNQLAVAPTESRGLLKTLFGRHAASSDGNAQAQPGNATLPVREPVPAQPPSTLTLTAHQEPVADDVAPAVTKPAAPAVAEPSPPPVHAEPRRLPAGDLKAPEEAKAVNPGGKSPLTYYPTKWRRLGVNEAPAAEHVAAAPVAVPHPTSEITPARLAPPTPAVEPVVRLKPTPVPAAEASSVRMDRTTVILDKPAPLVTAIPVREEPPALRNLVLTSHPQPLPATLANATPSAAPAPVAREPEKAKTSGYVSSGVILMESTETVVEAPRVQKPEWVVRQSRLQQSIARACGKALKDVEVTLTSDTTLLVRVKAHYAAEGDGLSTTIFQMPELAPYQVSLDIPLVQ